MLPFEAAQMSADSLLLFAVFTLAPLSMRIWTIFSKPKNE